MRVRCYEEGNEDAANDYNVEPDESLESIAMLYVEEWHEDTRYTVNVCVSADDTEARAMPGWHSDEEDPAFRMFVVTPVLRFACAEVKSFRPDEIVRGIGESLNRLGDAP